MRIDVSSTITVANVWAFAARKKRRNDRYLLHTAFIPLFTGRISTMLIPNAVVPIGGRTPPEQTPVGKIQCIR